MDKKILNFLVWATGCLFACSAYALIDDKETNEVVINFKVEVKQNACEVYVGQPMSQSPVIDMGTFSTNSGANGPLKPLFFQFKNCIGVKQIESIAYTRDIGATTNQNVVPGTSKDGFISTNNPKVRIYLYSIEDSTRKFEGMDFRPSLHTIDDKEMLPVCFAQAKVWDTTAAKPGKFEGKAEFTITYH